jgi:hypothetical protein
MVAERKFVIKILDDISTPGRDFNLHAKNLLLFCCCKNCFGAAIRSCHAGQKPQEKLQREPFFFTNAAVIADDPAHDLPLAAGTD